MHNEHCLLSAYNGENEREFGAAMLQHRTLFNHTNGLLDSYNNSKGLDALFKKRGGRMKAIGVVGSKRKKGNTSTLVQETLKALETEGIDTELVFLGDYDIESCHGCEGCKDTFKCVIRDDMQKLYPLILESDAIVLGSPTYFYNISSDMKAFLERCYTFEVFSEDDRSVWMSINEIMGGKYAVTLAVCEQETEGDMGFTSEAMTKPLEALGYRVVEAVKILRLFKQGEAIKDTQALQQAKKAGEKLAKTLKLRKVIEAKLKTSEIK